MKYKDVRTFVRDAGNSKYREVVQINDAEGIMKIYSQDKEIGFPFSEYTLELTEAGYKSSESYFKRMVINNAGTKEVNTDKQIVSEIEGLVNLAKYRKEHGCYRCLVLKDGTMKNDIIDRLKIYGLTESEAVHKITLAFGEV